MAGKRKKRRRRRGQDKNPLLLFLIPAVAVVVLIAVLAGMLWAGSSKPASSGVSSEEAGKQQTQSGQSEQTEQTGQSELAEQIPGDTQDADSTAESLSEDTSADESAGQTQNQAVVSTVAAEVGSMEDEEDPQEDVNAQRGGAAVDVSEISVPEYETQAKELGIDVSKYQGNIDWAGVKEAGIRFAMIRVGYRTKATGMIYEDPGARYNLQEATKNGIKAGAYFFSSAVNEQEAKEEAAWVSSFISRYSITYPVAYNCEDFQSPDSRQYGLTKEERTKLACAFLDTVQANGYTPMFYASKNEMEGSAQWDMGTLESRYLVWVSQYPEKPFPETAASTYSGRHAMWQYTSQGQIFGIGKKVDVNVSYFGADLDIQPPKDTTPAEAVEADPEVGIRFQEVEETVTAKDVTNLRRLPTTQDDSVVYQLKNGETVQRTGIGSNGWDRVIYNGQKLYAVHNFLTTDLSARPSASVENGESQTGADSRPEESSAANGSDGAKESQQEAAESTSQVGGLTFRAVEEAVTARDRVNLRDFPSTETGNVVGTLSYGEAVVRTGISGSVDTGWSRLLVNGQTVYASSRLLATSMDYKEQEKPSAEQPEAGMHFVAASGNVKAKDGRTNLRTLPTTNEPSAVVAELTGDTVAQRIGIDRDKGWTKLLYNGQTVYAVTNYLKEAE